MKIGCHVSIAKSIDLSFTRADEIGCTTFQIFTKNPRGWFAKPLENEAIEKFKHQMVQSGISPIFAHISYLPNLASLDEIVYKKSIESLLLELERCMILTIPYFIIHGGSYKGGSFEQGFDNYVNSILKGLEVVKNKVTILVENSAGGKNSLTGDINNIAKILEEIGDEKSVKFCFDTCHGFGAGYDLRNKRAIDNTLSNIESSIGIDNLILIHANDSKGDFMSNRDIHEHIGLGKIGEEGFIELVNHLLLKNKFWILETPVNEIRGDRENIKFMLSLVRNKKE
ncbi:MAG: deoxyribonuclease IV [Candidatus Thorarchaeota archaeon]